MPVRNFLPTAPSPSSFPLEDCSSLPRSSSTHPPYKNSPFSTQPKTSIIPSSSFFLFTTALMAPSSHHKFLASTAFLCLIHFFLIRPNPSLATRPLPPSDGKVAATNAGAVFIKTSCISTIYPDLCFSSLYSYASSINSSPMLLAHTALSISLDGARSTSAAMRSTKSVGGGGRPMSPREQGAMSDCMENVADSISELKDSLAEMGNLRGRNIGYQINSIQTWVSAALTDDDTCMDGLAGKTMEDSAGKSAVRGRVANVAHLTSNALAFINALASATQSAAAVTP